MGKEWSGRKTIWKETYPNTNLHITRDKSLKVGTQEHAKYTQDRFEELCRFYDLKPWDFEDDYGQWSGLCRAMIDHLLPAFRENHSGRPSSHNYMSKYEAYLLVECLKKAKKAYRAEENEIEKTILCDGNPANPIRPNLVKREVDVLNRELSSDSLYFNGLPEDGNEIRHVYESDVKGYFESRKISVFDVAANILQRQISSRHPKAVVGPHQVRATYDKYKKYIKENKLESPRSGVYFRVIEDVLSDKEPFSPPPPDRYSTKKRSKS